MSGANTAFNPLLQPVSFLSASQRPVTVPIPSIDAFNDETVSVAINYAFQLGACATLLVVVLLMTPPSKLRRASSALHVAGLVACIVRTGFLVAFFLSPLNHFYQFWAGDYSSVPRRFLYNSVAGTVFSLLLFVLLQAALMHQAWTMVSLWPAAVRSCLAVASAAVSLTAVGWRLAFAVVQTRSALDLVPARDRAWVVHAALILNALSICWYCALFNVKLVLHLAANRGILRSSPRSLSPMEVLVVTNGVLMVIPVVFAALEWGRFQNFEAASLTQTSVAVVLPLGTLAAQQITAGGSLAYLSGGSNKSGSRSNGGEKPNPPSAAAAGFKAVSTTCGSGGLGQSPSLFSACTGRGARPPGMDHFDLELRKIDSDSALANEGVRIDTDLEQNETRI
ncbi:pheromone receptor [Metarhizium album ARSEF 1941]|uniref:Pheromone receptor n=1 Tax=Metarhizium album (strain ARSEF 1941) TaxID=1081103 RepID=A0A0B2WQA5_METAS|nr:pheromone receptor [Metarhizium album ARSEF 1941]KHN95175.1 pheromone receptor [Metarhizium album ARSEF 1941]